MHATAEMYQGFALAEREQNLRDDSYFYLMVWNPETAQPEEHQYAATAYPSSPMGFDTVQHLLALTPESVKAAYAKWTQDMLRVGQALSLDYTMHTVKYYWRPFKGDTVRVARGRKVRKGLVGTVLTSSERTYGYDAKRTYVLIDCGSDGTWTVDTNNVDCVTRAQNKLQELFDLSN